MAAVIIREVFVDNALRGIVSTCWIKTSAWVGKLVNVL